MTDDHIRVMIDDGAAPRNETGPTIEQLNRQAAMQGYQDVYIELSWMSVCLILLAFMLSKNRPGQGPGASAMH